MNFFVTTNITGTTVYHNLSRYSSLWVQPSWRNPDNYAIVGRDGSETVQIAQYSSEEGAESSLEDLVKRMNE